MHWCTSIYNHKFAMRTIMATQHIQASADDSCSLFISWYWFLHVILLYDHPTALYEGAAD